MAKQIIRGRPSKAALGRMKVVTVAVSLAAFLGSLGVIAGNENQAITAASTSMNQVAMTTSTTAATGSSTSAASTTSQQPSFSAPITRNRGS